MLSLLYRPPIVEGLSQVRRMMSSRKQGRKDRSRRIGYRERRPRSKIVGNSSTPPLWQPAIRTRE